MGNQAWLGSRDISNKSSIVLNIPVIFTTYLHTTGYHNCADSSGEGMRLPVVLSMLLLLVSHVPQQRTSLAPCDTELDFARNGHSCIMEGDRRRCFCINMTSAAWDTASQLCSSLAPTGGAMLAIDNSEASHRILLEVLRSANISQAWLGARTISLYFNWMATQENLEARAIYYQGCYADSAGDMVKNKSFHSVRNLRESCQEACSNKRTKYFGLKSDANKFSCYCGNKFGMKSTKPEYKKCSKCSKEGNSVCGIGALAVYVVNVTSKFHKWMEPHPVLSANSCLVSRRYGSEYSYGTRECYTRLPLHFCWKDAGQVICNESGGFNSEYSGRCFREFKEILTYSQLAVTCDRWDGSLLTLKNESEKEDIEKTIKTPLPFWVGGTSMRWAWKNGSADEWEEVTISDHHWLEREAFPFVENCMLLDQQGIWQAAGCNSSQHNKFICEITLPRMSSTAGGTSSHVITREATTTISRELISTKRTHITTSRASVTTDADTLTTKREETTQDTWGTTKSNFNSITTPVKTVESTIATPEAFTMTLDSYTTTKESSTATYEASTTKGLTIATNEIYSQDPHSQTTESWTKPAEPITELQQTATEHTTRVPSSALPHMSSTVGGASLPVTTQETTTAKSRQPTSTKRSHIITSIASVTTETDTMTMKREETTQDPWGTIKSNFNSITTPVKTVESTIATSEAFTMTQVSFTSTRDSYTTTRESSTAMHDASTTKVLTRATNETYSQDPHSQITESWTKPAEPITELQQTATEHTTGVPEPSSAPAASEMVALVGVVFVPMLGVVVLAVAIATTIEVSRRKNQFALSNP